ncbi:MAG: HNH endonuclease [Oligoflexia bacterium]|nr:HNH endonuclease [Oligoflexia bacterium]
MTPDDDFFLLDSRHVDPARLKREREKARKLRKSQWWLTLVNRGLCHYCGGKFPASELTMDHVVPLARGGESTQGNLVPSCRDCNREKKLRTPAEDAFRQLEEERRKRESGSGEPAGEPAGEPE